MKGKVIIALFALLYSHSSFAAYVYGRYTGDGNATQAITGLGFSPVVVLVKGAANRTAWFSSTNMGAGYSKTTDGDGAPGTDHISSIDADGFTVKNHADANTNNEEYFFVAWDSNDATVGSFTPTPDTYDSGSSYTGGSKVTFSGSYYEANTWVNAGETPVTHSSKWDAVTLDNPTSGTNVNLGYRPIMVWTISQGTQWYDNGAAQFVWDGSNSGNSYHFNLGTSLGPEDEVIDDITALGFSFNTPEDAGTSSKAVFKGTEYEYVAFTGTSGYESGTYTGNSTDDRKVTTTNQPDFVMIKDFGGGQNVSWRSANMSGDTAYLFKGDVKTNYIKGFETDGFNVGLSGEVNDPGVTYEYLAFTGGTPLPVEMVYFNAEKLNDNEALVSWQTGMEINSSHFEVYRSKDGVNFEKIGVVAAAGNSQVPLNYNFVDEAPFGGVNYYKLKAVDFDGKHDWTEVKAVNFGRGQKLTVFPNPGVNEITLNLESHILETYTFKIYDKAGKLVYQKVINNSEGLINHQVNVSQFAAEVYSVMVQSKTSGVMVQKFIKK